MILEPKNGPWPTDGATHSWGMLDQASTFAADTDNLYVFIFILTVIAFIGILAVMGYFMYAYRRKTPDQKTSSITHNGKIEFLWSAIPAVLMIVIFVWGDIAWMRQTTPPTDAMEVRVTGRQWAWDIEYPDYPGVRLSSSNDENDPQTTLVIPKGVPVKFVMTSTDVLHAFYIPAFRIKRDVIPGRYNTMWVEATQTGTFTIYCAEYCGDLHSKMFGVVKVLEPEDFEAELMRLKELLGKQQEGETTVQFGERLTKQNGCGACHSVDGSKMTGPTWKGLWGRTSQFTDGTSATVDENYVRQSILEPNAKLVSGYAGQMPSFQGKFNDEQLAAVIAYLKTLK